MKSKLLTLTLAAFMAIAGKTQAQVIFYNGFENWAGTPLNPTQWMGAPATNIVPDSVMQVVATGTLTPEEGTYACKLKNVSSTHVRFATQPVAIVGGQAYEISYYARGKGSIRAGIYTGKVDTTGGNFAYTYAGYESISGKTWHKCVQTLIADTSNANGQFILSVKSTSSYTASTPAIIGVDVDSFCVRAYTPQNNVSLYNIQYTQAANGNSPFYGQFVLHTGGIVTAITKNSSGSPNGYYLQSSGSSSWAGCLVFDYTSSATIALGDSVTLSAAVDEYFSMTELTQVYNFVKVSSGNPIPAPIQLTTQTVNQEMYESMLVGVSMATCNTYTANYGQWTATDGSGVPVTVDTKSEYVFTPTVNNVYCIIGPVNYEFSAFNIVPRFAADVISAPCGVGIANYSYGTNAHVYPNPVGNALTVSLPFVSEKTTVSLIDVLGKELMTANGSGSEIVLQNVAVPAGVYLVKIVADGKTQLVKVIKQ
jgi:hypothetical protein